MATFPSLLNVGEPLIFQGVPAPRTVSPFAGLLTPTGTMPLPPVPTRAAVSTAPPAAPALAPAPVTPPLFEEQEPRRNLYSFHDEQTPMGVVDFTSAVNAPDPSAVGALEAFGLTAGTPAEIAGTYASQYADQVAPMGSLNPISGISNAFSQPLSTTLDQVFSQQHAVPGAMLGIGVPGAGFALSAMANVNEHNQAYDRAMAEMGIPGYSYGTIDGQKFSTSPGPFGYGRVMSGVVPSWFDIDMFDKMQSIELGIDPNSGTGIETTNGVQGYNQYGQYVDQFGNISAHGTMEDLESLARDRNISIEAARDALNQSRSGELSLYDSLLDAYNREKGYTDHVGPPDYDPGFDPAVDPTPDINMDPLSAEIDYDAQAEADAAASAAAAGDYGFGDPEGGGDIW